MAEPQALFDVLSNERSTRELMPVGQHRNVRAMDGADHSATWMCLSGSGLAYGHQWKR
ncbi:hypothetical protein [Aliidiomarina iranensis]|uniref:hypothetical protein n=1 Tax=Aliidiomarina iranensis TaxID=1434071 RepID=UPI0013005982|nr:hypothetical protein [Aliidiomarina iranensis]